MPLERWIRSKALASTTEGTFFTNCRRFPVHGTSVFRISHLECGAFSIVETSPFHSLTLPATFREVQNLTGQRIVNIALRTACSEDMVFARNLYFETMRGMIERLFGWDQAREDRNFAAFFKLDEVRIITVDGQDV